MEKVCTVGRGGGDTIGGGGGVGEPRTGIIYIYRERERERNVHSHTDRASWDAILVTVVGFGALMWKKCAQWGGWGGGYHWRGGGSANREPGSYIYIYIYRERENDKV